LLLRPSYEVVHGPLQFVEDAVMSHRARRNPLRVGYEWLLVGLDDAAGRLLGDEAAAIRADALRERTASARAEIADFREREARRFARAGQARMQRYRLYREDQAARSGPRTRGRARLDRRRR
jgi:hypothetical protein